MTPDLATLSAAGFERRQRKGAGMKKSRNREEQDIGMLKEHEAGLKPPELCLKHNISAATSYQWKAKCGGMYSNTGTGAIEMFSPDGDVIRDPSDR